MDLIALILVVIANILLGLLVLKSRPKLMNFIFFGMSLMIVSWSLCNYYAEFSSGSLQLFLTRATYASAIGMGEFFLLFTVLFPRGNSKNFRLYSLITGALSIIGILVCFFPGFVDSVVVSGKDITINTGVLFPMFLVIFPAALILGLSILIYKYYFSKGVLRLQIQYVFLGTFLLIFIASLSNIFIPIITGNYDASRYGPLATVFLVGLTSYAIIRHRLMDIKMVVARSLAYIILLATLAAFYALSVLGLEALLFPGQLANFDWYQGAMRTVIAVIMVFLFQPLKIWITKVTDKIFFRNAYDPDELLSQLSNTMGSTIVLIELLYKVGDIIQQNLKASRVLFVLTKDDSRLYTVQAVGYKKTPDVDPRDIQKLTRDGMIHYDDLEEGSRMKHLLSEYEANLAVPLKTEGETVGVVLLGEKSSGDMYSQQDLNVLEILGPELAIAVENAKAYEEISRFNTTLRQEVKRATYRLKQKNEQLMELDHAKDEFISMASHQLRTPLTAIKGYLSMLLEGDAGDIKVSQYDFINEAYSGANRMVGLINDLLNVSRMDTGRFFLEPKEVDIEKVVNEEAKQLQNAAKAKGLYLKIEAKGKVPHIWADETKIRQVVMNFMDNAIYYTNTGGVTVVLKHDKDNFIYEVHDTGIGVPPAQREHLFEKFFRADNARTARPDGTGLGIYLAKRVVQDHGGEIIFDSVEGKGSTFGFKFPLKKKVEPKEVPVAPAPAASATISEVQKEEVTQPVGAVAEDTHVK
jgi:signal transduction histidine kinase